jgi:hypothetical protein
MARDFYETTIALADGAAAGTVKSLAGVKVSVVPRAAVDVPGSLIDIFQAATGATKGPDPKSGASGTNPFTTNASGSVRFWADAPAELDLVYEDTITPARITDRISWNAVPAKAASIPTSSLVADAGLTVAHMSAGAVNNLVPIGAVIEWWRPNVAVPVPTGFVICDGLTTLAVGQHDFPWANPVTVPDLRNLFILGADITEADNTGHAGQSTQAIADAPDSAPGIRGTGGSHVNQLTLTQIPAHNHSPTSDGKTGLRDRNQQHTHGIGGNYPLLDTPGGMYLTDGSVGANAQVSRVGIAPSGTDAPDHQHSLATQGGNGLHSSMPKWIGLLRIMKVKR